MNTNIVTEAFFANLQAPLHAGAFEGSRRADKAIQRETGSGLPKVDGTIWKGSFLEQIRNQQPENSYLIETIQNHNIGKNPSQYSFSDLKLLFFPVHSTSDLFALVTCPKILQRFVDEMTAYEKIEKQLGDNLKNVMYWLRDDTIYKWKEKKDSKQEIIANAPFKADILHDNIKSVLHRIPLEESQKNRVSVVTDKNFDYLVKQETEIIIRNKLEDNRTSSYTGLFSEEFLPEESILYGFVTRFQSFINQKEKNYLDKISEIMSAKMLLGGATSLGKGLVEWRRAVI